MKRIDQFLTLQFGIYVSYEPRLFDGAVDSAIAWMGGSIGHPIGQNSAVVRELPQSRRS
jgi:hypothetical protein